MPFASTQSLIQANGTAGEAATVANLSPYLVVHRLNIDEDGADFLVEDPEDHFLYWHQIEKAISRAVVLDDL